MPEIAVRECVGLKTKNTAVSVTTVAEIIESAVNTRAVAAAAELP